MSVAEELERCASAPQESLPTVVRCCGRGCRQRYLAEAMWTERVEPEMKKRYPRLMASWIFQEEAYCPRCKRPGMWPLKWEHTKYVDFLMSIDL